jgi:hypothetical protein
MTRLHKSLLYAKACNDKQKTNIVSYMVQAIFRTDYEMALLLPAQPSHCYVSAE